MTWDQYAAAMGRPGAPNPTTTGWQPQGNPAPPAQTQAGQAAYGLRQNPQASQQYPAGTYQRRRDRRANRKTRRVNRRANRRANRKSNTRRRR